MATAFLVAGCTPRADLSARPERSPQDSRAQADTAAVSRSRPVPVGREAPPFSLKRLGGGHLSLASLRGNIVVLSFWTPSCPPCHIEAPHLQRLHQKYRSLSVRFMGIAPLTSVPQMHAFVKTHSLSYDSAVDPAERVARAYGLAGYPATFVVDKQGVVRYSVLGYHAGDEHALEAKIRTLL